MKKFLFLLFVILSLNAISTVTYESIPPYPWFQDISIVGHDYNSPCVILKTGESLDMTLLTFAVDHVITTCKTTIYFVSDITPYPVLGGWVIHEDAYSVAYQEIKYTIYDIVEPDGRWVLGAVTMHIYMEDQYGEVIGAAKIPMLIL